MSSRPIAVQPTDWCDIRSDPEALLGRVLPAVAPGTLCYVGRLTEARARALRQAGFDIEHCLLPGSEARADRQAPPGGVREREVDPRTMVLPELRYAVVVLDGVLPLLSPKDGDRLVSSVRRATRPGGVVIASVLSTEDPAYEALRPAEAAVARRAVRFEDGRWLRFHLRGELEMAFDGWILLHARDEAASDGRGRERIMTVVVARRPSGASLLA